MNKIFFLGLTLLSLVMLNTGCKKSNGNEDKLYTGRLKVLQKDAYSETAGRTSMLWPPHTTTVFEWDKDTLVQVNHGTSPDEVDENGDTLLVKVRTYTFSATKEEMEKLEMIYKDAVMDDISKFLSFSNASGELEKALLTGLRQYMEDGANGLEPVGPVSKDSLLKLFDEYRFFEFIGLLPQFSWDKSDWNKAFLTVLEDVLNDFGENIQDYHVCNDDAQLQVNLIKNFKITGKIEMPKKVKNGPLIYYLPL